MEQKSTNGLQEKILYDIIQAPIKLELGRSYGFYYGNTFIPMDSETYIKDHFNSIREKFDEVAQEYDCRFEFREGKFENNPNNIINEQYFGACPNGKWVSGVIVGNDTARIDKAIKEIYKKYGFKLFKHGNVDVTDKNVVPCNLN